MSVSLESVVPAQEEPAVIEETIPAPEEPAPSARSMTEEPPAPGNPEKQIHQKKQIYKQQLHQLPRREGDPRKIRPFRRPQRPKGSEDENSTTSHP